jgi:hypothetical protein
VDFEGNTILHIAVLKQIDNTVEWILENVKMNVNRLNSNGKAAMDLCNDQGYKRGSQLMQNYFSSIHA